MDVTLPLSAAVSRAARLYPSRPAIVSEEGMLTWRELDSSISQLSNELANSGVKAGERVAIWMSKSSKAIQALLALLRVGATPIPLDPRDPPQRIFQMFKNANICKTLVEPHHKEKAGSILADLQLGSTSGREIGNEITLFDCDKSCSSSLDKAGYLLFTSGSTGTPKGVLLSQENVFFFAQWAAEEIKLTQYDRVGSQSSLTFDLSTFDIFASAIAGACICLMENEIRAFGSDILKWIIDTRISVFYAVPSLLKNLVKQSEVATSADELALHTIIYAGEPFPTPDLRALVNALPKAAVYNFYGPTNVCTYEKIEKLIDGEVSIGRPVRGVLVGTFDDNLNPAEEGQLWISGPNVMLGYVQEGELKDPTRLLMFAGQSEPKRAYPSGDIAYHDKDGRLLLKGRRDNQIKRNGYRIDLQDIESTLLTIPEIVECAVVATRLNEEMEIAAFIVPTVAITSAHAAVLAIRVLPQRMMPNKFCVTNKLPLTANGKIDRKELLAQIRP